MATRERQRFVDPRNVFCSTSWRSYSLTTQMRDKLNYESMTYDLIESPLPSCPEFQLIKPKPGWFFKTPTSCYRGYTASWSVHGSQLFLETITPYGRDELRLSALFGATPSPVFANWYTGLLRCPTGQRGAPTSLTHRTSSHELHIRIEHGRVIDSQKTVCM